MNSISVLCFGISRARFSWNTEPDVFHLKQVHSADGVLIHRNQNPSELARKEGDWIVSFNPQVSLGIKVADCTAILGEGRAENGDFILAIHAGWRGTASGVIENCLQSLAKVSGKPGNLRFWLSPSICQKCFEVGGEVLEALGADSKNFAHKKSSASDKEKYLLDLKGFQFKKLKSLGASEVFSNPLCTFCQPDFISYRRAKGSLKTSERHWATITLKS